METLFELAEGRYGMRLRLDSAWTAEIAQVAAETNVEAITIGPATRNLDFLRELPQLKSLNYLHDGADTAPIHFLHELRQIHITNLHNATIDFGAFPELEDCTLMGSTGVDSVFQAISLRRLVIGKLSKKRFERLESLVNLMDLTVFGSDTPSISPLCHLLALQKVRLVRFRKLLDNSTLSCLTDLRDLWIQDCSGFTSLDVLQSNIKLEYLNLEGVGSIQTLSPLASLTDLHSVFIGGSKTQLEDKDLAPVWSRPGLRRFLVACEGLNWFSPEESKSAMG